MIGGECPWRYTSPQRICQAHRLSTSTSIERLCFLRYCRSVPLVNSSVMKLTVAALPLPPLPPPPRVPSSSQLS